MFLILTKRTTPVVALIMVPGVLAIIAQASGVATVPDCGVTRAIMNSIRDFAPTAALPVFAIISFGLMIDVGTAVLAILVSLDVDDSTTFIITVSALRPVYLRLGLSQVVLTVPPDALFLPVLPSMAAAIGVILLFAFELGRMERRRLPPVRSAYPIERSGSSPALGHEDTSVRPGRPLTRSASCRLTCSPSPSSASCTSHCSARRTGRWTTPSQDVAAAARAMCGEGRRTGPAGRPLPALPALLISGRLAAFAPRRRSRVTCHTTRLSNQCGTPPDHHG